MNEDEKVDIVGRIFQDKEFNDRIYIIPESQSEALIEQCNYGDIHEATCRYLTDILGFSTASFKVSDASKKMQSCLIAQVDFIDDGIVMAKLHGLTK